MAEEADLRFLGEQLKRLQGDVRQLKTGMARLRAGNVKFGTDFVGLQTNVCRVEGQLEAFRERVDDRFEQTMEFLKSSFRTLSGEIQQLKARWPCRWAAPLLQCDGCSIS